MLKHDQPVAKPAQPDSPKNKSPLATDPITVTCLAIISGVSFYTIVRWWYSILASISWVPALPLAVLVIVDIVCAVMIRSALAQGRVGQDRSQLHPLFIARCLPLGRASTYSGAVVAGAAIGAGIHLWPQATTLAAARSDTPGLIVYAGVGILLMCAGLLLERACRVPSPPEDDDLRSTSPSSSGMN